MTRTRGVECVTRINRLRSGVSWRRCRTMRRTVRRVMQGACGRQLVQSAMEVVRLSLIYQFGAEKTLGEAVPGGHILAHTIDLAGSLCQLPENRPCQHPTTVANERHKDPQDE